MESLIPMVNKLQNVFCTIGNDTLLLPQIVVLGTQSSGKSSVLENLVGKSFLPRGAGIVTRRPLVLQLINVTPTHDQPFKEWGVFWHKKDVIFDNFDHIRNEIEAETKKVAGNNKGISSEPISLRIYSSKVVDLTLIDLPGLTKVPVGDQPPDVEALIRKMVYSYIRNPNAIILSVITANTDMATSESLQMAREVDPQGLRTVAVVTKLDLMDSGTDAIDILTGKIIPVRLGIVGVVNRSQKDINDNKTMEDSKESEAMFFKTKYPTIAATHGTPYLAKTMNRILVHHIYRCLPELKSRISGLRSQTTAELLFLGEGVTDSSKVILQVISRFCTSYCSALDGTSRKIETRELCGGARICYIFHETFGKTLESIQPLTGLSQVDILTAMRNATGTRPALFIPEVCFEMLVKRQIERLLEPSLLCVELIHDEMQRVVERSAIEVADDVARFPLLYDRIALIVSDLLRTRLPATRDMVKNLINLELAYINNLHPEFRSNADISGVQKWQPGKLSDNSAVDKRPSSKESSKGVPSPRDATIKKETQIVPASSWFSSFLPSHNQPDSPTTSKTQICLSGRGQTPNEQRLTDRELCECNVIEKLITSYFNVVRKNVEDSVPKAIMYLLVNHVREHLNRELVEALYKTERYEELVKESEHITTKRAQLQTMIGALDHAEAILSELRSVPAPY